MRMTRNIIFLLMQILAANTASAESTNPCAASVNQFCGGANGKEARECLARKLNHIDEKCAERITQYYLEHPDEALPGLEDPQVKAENKKQPYFDAPRAEPPTRRVFSNDTYPQAGDSPVEKSRRPDGPSQEMYNSDSSLQKQMDEYYAPPTLDYFKAE